MGNYESLKNAIIDVIRENNNNEITGDLLQSVLLAIVSNVGENATFAGVATASTNPGTPDQNVFYIAKGAGQYTGFGNLSVTSEVSILSNKTGAWTATDIGVITSVYNLGTCSTAGNVAAKVVTIPGVNINSETISKQRFIIRFENVNTAAPVVTLSINGVTAKLFLNGYEVTPQNSWSKNQRIEVYYDLGSGGWLARYYSWLTDDETRTTNTFAPSSLGARRMLMRYGWIRQQLSGVFTDGYISTADGLYHVSSQFYGMLIPVTPGSQLLIQPNTLTTSFSIYTFLSSPELTDGVAPASVSATTRIDGEILTIVPDNATYLWVYAQRNTENVTPAVNLLLSPSEYEQQYDDVYVAVVMDSNSLANMFLSTTQLFDMATGTAYPALTYADKGIVGKLPKYSTAMYQKYPFEYLYAKNATIATQPASTTKVWSLAVGMPYVTNIYDKITFVSEDFASGSSLDSNLHVGDILTIEGIMYGMMLPSSNTCANAFARYVGGKILEIKGQSTYTNAEARAEFIAEMNRKATKLGFINSTFTSPSGLGETNVSCAVDMFRAVVEACSHNEILRIWNKHEYEFDIQGANPQTVQYVVGSNANRENLERKYNLLGRKSGSLTIEGVRVTYAYVAVANKRRG